MPLFPENQQVLKILVGSRASCLAQAQAKEVLNEIQSHFPFVTFEVILINTMGDKDKTTSLRNLDKSDFFTREIEELQLNGGCQISIHSAKDLPQELKKGLVIAAITEGIDASDVLVMQDGSTLARLPSGSVIATSSQRREEAVKRLRTDLNFIDLRGTIEERLLFLKRGQAAGVVIAEAALIRLGFTYLNRLRLPGEAAPFQGKLAILAREEDHAMIELFSTIDSRKTLRNEKNSLSGA